MEIPSRFLTTQTLAPDTFLVRQVLGEGMGPVVAPVNSMVIRAEEPVIVDTAMAITRDDWLEHTFALVEPADVRWIFLSHDDSDHIGALFHVLDMCPQATLVTNMFSVLRMSADRLLPLDRLRFVNPGESFSVGDRELVAVVPPIYDSPTTRGLFDPVTGVYWAADAFCVEASRTYDDAEEMDPDELGEAFLHSQRMVSPWHQLLDAESYRTHVGRLRSLRPTVAVGAHGMVFRGAELERSWDLYAELPALPPVPLVSQSDLEVMLDLLAPAPA